MEEEVIQTYAKSDRQYLQEIGEFVKQSRINKNKTQTVLAKLAGVNRTTLSQLEQGRSVNLLSLIQILRAVEQLHVLKAMDTKRVISPLKLAELEHKHPARQRVRNTASKATIVSQSDW